MILEKRTAIQSNGGGNHYNNESGTNTTHLNKE